MNRDSQTREGVQVSLRERLKEATNGAILSAAEAVLVERGIELAKMEEIAGRAGVSVGTLYNHFHDRDAIINALAAARRREVMEQLDTALADSAALPFGEQLQAFLRGYFSHIVAHGAFMSAMIEKELCMPEAGRPQPRLIAAELLKRADVLVGRGIAQGVLRQEDSAFHATTLMGMTRGVIARYLFRPQPGDPPRLEQVDRTARYFLQGAGV
jgi:AcrR family transcriptional regulator